MLTFLRTAALVFLVTLHTAASTEYAPFVTFNNGKETANMTCTKVEMDLITETVKKAAVSGKRGRRRLGWGKQQKRELQLIKCMPLKAWATSKCGGARTTRRLKAENAAAAATDRGAVRKLQSDVCAAKTTKFNAELDSVSTKVSSQCKDFITTRSFECRQVLDCDITAFHTWHVSNNTIFKSNFPAPGGTNTLCSRSNWAFQADTDFDVGNVQLTLTGPNGYSFTRTEYQASYYLYGNKGANGANLVGNRPFFNGALLQVGTYTLTATAMTAPESPLVAQFTIIDCE